MELNKPNLKNWFGPRRGAHVGTDPLKRRPRPFRDWRRLSITWLIGLIVISGLHLWLFRNLEKSIAREVENQVAGGLPRLNPEKLHRVVEYWKQKTNN